MERSAIPDTFIHVYIDKVSLDKAIGGPAMLDRMRFLFFGNLPGL